MSYTQTEELATAMLPAALAAASWNLSAQRTPPAAHPPRRVCSEPHLQNTRLDEARAVVRQVGRVQQQVRQRLQHRRIGREDRGDERAHGGGDGTTAAEQAAEIMREGPGVGGVITDKKGRRFFAEQMRLWTQSCPVVMIVVKAVFAMTVVMAVFAMTAKMAVFTMAAVMAEFAMTAVMAVFAMTAVTAVYAMAAMMAVFAMTVVMAVFAMTVVMAVFEMTVVMAVFAMTVVMAVFAMGAWAKDECLNVCTCESVYVFVCVGMH